MVNPMINMEVVDSVARAYVATGAEIETWRQRIDSAGVPICELSYSAQELARDIETAQLRAALIAMTENRDHYMRCYHNASDHIRNHECQPQDVGEAAEYKAKQKSMIIGEAVCYHDGKWPKQLGGGTMYFNGERITIEQFTERAKLAYPEIYRTGGGL